MAPRSKTAAAILEAAPTLPLDPEHWLAVVEAMGISTRQATVAELMLRDLSVRQIVEVTGLAEGTVKDYQRRIAQRTGTRGRMQLAMHVLELSHQVVGNRVCGANRNATAVQSDGI